MGQQNSAPTGFQRSGLRRIRGGNAIDATRAEALDDAIQFHHHIEDDMRIGRGESRFDTYIRLTEAVLTTADRFLTWLRGPNRLLIEFGDIVNQDTLLPTGNTNAGGNMAQLHDNEQVDITVSAVDGKGFASADTITYAVDDETVVTVVGGTDEDTQTATLVAGVPGSAVVTITDAGAVDSTTGLPLSATLAVDVIAAGAVAINVAVGTPVLQP
jgi:hypothetical protein